MSFDSGGFGEAGNVANELTTNFILTSEKLDTFIISQCYQDVVRRGMLSVCRCGSSSEDWRMRIIIVFFALLCIFSPASAQQAAPLQPPPAAAGPPPSAAPARPQVNECREKGAQQNLRGEALRDFVQVCRLEKRLACLKDAIAKHIVGPERGAFMKSCAD